MYNIKDCLIKSKFYVDYFESPYIKQKKKYESALIMKSF